VSTESVVRCHHNNQRIKENPVFTLIPYSGYLEHLENILLYRELRKMLRLKNFTRDVFVEEDEDYSYGGFQMKPKEKHKVSGDSIYDLTHGLSTDR